MSEKESEFKKLDPKEQFELIARAVYDFVRLYVSNGRHASPKEQKLITQLIDECIITEEYLVIYLVTQMYEELENGDHETLYNIGSEASKSGFTGLMQRINKKPNDANLLTKTFSIYMKKHLFDS